MKVLFYISTIRGGGAARVMVNIANGLASNGHEVIFVTNFPANHEYELDGRIDRHILEAEESRSNALVKNLTRIKALKKIIRKNDPDVSIAFMRENNFRLMFASKGLRTKTVVSVRNDPAKEYPSKFSKMLAEYLYKKADGIVFQTEDAKKAFSSRVQEKSCIIFNQVDEKFFDDNPARGDYIAACGRLSKQKNYPMMLRGFAASVKTHPDEHLKIYGEGNLKEEMEGLARELGIQENVEFMGFSTDMKSVYKNAKLLVMTSDYEGMPNAVLEALASSVPVISTDCPCGGPKMIIEEGKNGYLVRTRDSEDFTAKLNAFLDLSDEQNRDMRNNAFQTGQKFSPPVILKDWTDMLGRILKCC